MSLEHFPTEQENSDFAKKDTSGEEAYVKNAETEQSHTLGTLISQKVENSYKFSKENNAKLSNEFNTQQFNELVAGNLIEDLGYFSMSDRSFDEIVIESIEQGYTVSHFNVYDKGGEIIGHRYYRTKMDITENDSALKTSIDEKYKKLNSDKWYLGEQAKEDRFKKAVISGTMEYLGEMSFKEYGDIRKKGLPLERIEKLFVFDDEHNPISDRVKVYVKI